MAEELTRADIEALRRMPDEGWFEANDLPASMRCRDYRCQRLRDRGLLEWEVVGEDLRHLTSRYRKVKN